jgi:hypothetical protein
MIRLAVARAPVKSIGKEQLILVFRTGIRARAIRPTRIASYFEHF